jgi:hypothetical protein
MVLTGWNKDFAMRFTQNNVEVFVSDEQNVSFVLLVSNGLNATGKLSGFFWWIKRWPRVGQSVR